VLEKYNRLLIISFIVISTSVFVIIGQPVLVLVLVGSLNGLILPIALGVMLIAAHKAKIVGDYKHPLWMTVFGVVIVVAMAWMGIYTLMNGIPALFE
jgi:Mn2+/Fe2+ NRAMP family transporter